jgi:hypothetical protein
MHPEVAGYGVPGNRPHIALPEPVIAPVRAMPVSSSSIAWSGPQPPRPTGSQRVGFDWRIPNHRRQRLQQLNCHPGQFRVTSHF